MRSDDHYFASLNYLRRNPVKHGHVEKWQDWPWSSVHEYLDTTPKDPAEAMWRKYNIADYGKGWDE
jgi:putative transposase